MDERLPTAPLTPLGLPENTHAAHAALENIRSHYPEHKRVLQDELLIPTHQAMEKTLTMGELVANVYYTDLPEEKKQESLSTLLDLFGLTPEERKQYDGKSADQVKRFIEIRFAIEASKLNVVFIGQKKLTDRKSPLMHDIAEVRYEEIFTSIQTRLSDPENPRMANIPLAEKTAFLTRLQKAHDAPDKIGISIDLDRQPNPSSDSQSELKMLFHDELYALQYLSLYEGTLECLALDQLHNNFVASGQSDRFFNLPQEVQDTINPYIRSNRTLNVVDGVDLYSFHTARSHTARFADESEIINAIFGTDALRNLESKAQEKALRDMILSDHLSRYDLLRIIEAADHPDPLLVGQELISIWGDMQDDWKSESARYQVANLIESLKGKEGFDNSPYASRIISILEIVKQHPDTFYLPTLIDTEDPRGQELIERVTFHLNDTLSAIGSITNLETVIKLLSLAPSSTNGTNLYVSKALDDLHLQLSDIPLKPNPIRQQIETNLQQICIDVITGDEQQGLLASPIVIDNFIKSLGTRVLPELLHTYQEWPNYTQTPEVILAHLKKMSNYHSLIDYARHIQTLPTASREKIQREFSRGVLALTITQDHIKPNELKILSDLTGIRTDELADVLPVLRTIHKGEVQIVRELLEHSNWKTYVEIARHPQKSTVLQNLSQSHVSFTLNMDQLHTILSTSPEKFLDDIQTIITYFPSFKYQIARVKNFISPYDALIAQASPQELFLSLIQDDTVTPFAQETAKALYRKVTGKKLDDSLAPKLIGVFRELAKTVWDIEKVDPEDRQFFNSPHLLTYLARHPDEIHIITALALTHTKYLQLLRPGGILHSNRDRIIENLFASDDVFAEARRAEFIFTQKRPYWESLYYFAEQKLASPLENASTDYPISSIEGSTVTQLAHSPSVETLITVPEVIEEIKQGATTVPFSALSAEAKRLVFRDYLQRTIETSQSNEAKEAAHQRNVARITQSIQKTATSVLQFTSTMRIHGSSIDSLEPVLAYGNLCGEALGTSAAEDSYPFHVDLSIPNPHHQKVEDILNASISHTYGRAGKLGIDGQIYYLYERRGSPWEPEIDYGIDTLATQHALMFVGIPSSEITGIVLTNPQATKQIAIEQILSNGFYIPLYDTQGTLLFTPEDYQKLYVDLNLRVPIDSIEYTLRLDNQQGNGADGIFAIAETEGSIRYHIQFDANTEYTWNRQLADNFYKFAGLPVPNTKIVMLDSSLGHASEVLPENITPQFTALHDGALMDMWLANWDIIAHAYNMQQGYRVNNGGALLYKAHDDGTGNRKGEEFNETVVEFYTMRYGYPGITPEILRKQARRLKKQFTPEVIAQLVDSIRLPKEQRKQLIHTLIRRRQFLLDVVKEEPRATEVTPEGEQFINLLKADTLSDEKVAELVPRWDHLTSEYGHQHNGVLLGDHIKEVLMHVKNQDGYKNLSEGEQRLVLLAAFFHDFGKPTGRKHESVERDFEHERESARMAATYMYLWGYSLHEIIQVQHAIVYDGVVSDILIGDVQYQERNLSEEQLFRLLNNNRQTAYLLRLVNTADVLANAHPSSDFWDKFNAYFDRMEGKP